MLFYRREQKYPPLCAQAHVSLFAFYVSPVGQLHFYNAHDALTISPKSLATPQFSFAFNAASVRNACVPSFCVIA